MATGSHDSIVRVIDVSTKDTPINYLKGHSGEIYTIAWHPCFSSMIASGASDNTIRIWDIKTVLFL